jgi:hypothetical protein
MSRLENSLLRSAAVLAVVVLTCSLAGASEQQPESAVAETVFVPTGLSWHPAVAYESAVLAVSGPGDFAVRREFAANETLAFLVNDRNQPVLEDGQYAWELRFSPVTDAMVKEALRAARESGDTGEIDALKREGKLPSEPLVISGYFRVKGGWIVADDSEGGPRRAELRPRPAGSTGGVVDADPTAGPIAKDQVILDDLIVDGSICVGFDCVNGESFGFDTLRLKENNLRIRAVDTSNTASFPTRDWQITFNETSNGGANKFSIDDIDGGRTPFTIEAGAPSHSLYVDDGGRIGFGTSTPVVELHVKDGDTPTLRLEQDGSSGFTAQTWDLAGNETNFFIRDVTNGSTLPFRIRPGAPTSSIDVAGDGDVGIGTSSPKAPLHVLLSGSAYTPYTGTAMVIQSSATATDWTGLTMIGGSSSNGQLNFGDTSTEFQGRIIYNMSSDFMDFYTNGTRRMRITGDGVIGIDTIDIPAGNVIYHSNGARLSSGGAWLNGSSRAFKQDINSLSAESALDALTTLKPVTFTYKTEPGEQYVGFISEEVPDLVASGDRKGISPMDVVAVLTKVVQEQQRRIDDLTKQLEALKEQQR